MSGAFTESEVEAAALAWLENVGWRIAHGPDIAPDMLADERLISGELRVKDAERFVVGAV